MTHEELSPMAQGYAVAMVESQEFWPDDFEADFDMFKFAEVDHFLPGANGSIQADCNRFIEMAKEEIGESRPILTGSSDDECRRIGHELWYQRLGRDTGFGTDDKMVDRAMLVAAKRLGRPLVGFCSIGYIQHTTQFER